MKVLEVLTSKFHLGIGPMSKEIIDSVLEYKPPSDVQLMFISSENQINRNKGYTGFTTKQFSNYVGNSDVWKCRDHCGPKFFFQTEEECLDTIRDDIESGFDLIHIDGCWLDDENKIRYTKKAMSVGLENPDMKFEIGTEVNSVQNKLDPQRLRDYLSAVTEIATPYFYVLETNSVVQGYSNSGKFDPCKESLAIFNEFGVKVKEHNADYINREQINKRQGIIHGMNIAPQFGVLQTSIILTQCIIYGIDASEFKNSVFASDKWKKWATTDVVSPDYAALLGGHYHFDKDPYKKLVDQLSKVTDVEATIKTGIKKLISHYINSYKETK